MGKPRKEAWPETWHHIKDRFETLLHGGESIGSKDAFFPVRRFGFLEECYFDYTLSPIKDDQGKTCGIFNIVTESTRRVVTERRNRLLHQLILQSHNFLSERQGYKQAAGPMEQQREDIPFCLLYKHIPRTDKFELCQTTGISAEQAAGVSWPLSAVLYAGEPQILALPEPLHDLLYPKNWPEPCSAVMLLPIKQGSGTLTGIMIAGIHPGIRLDEAYRNFLESTAVHIGIAIMNGTRFDTEKRAKSRVQESQNQLQFAIDAAGLGTWDLDPQTYRFSGNTRLKSWFGLPPDGEVDLSRAIHVIAPYDRLRVQEAIRKAMVFESGGNYTVEYTIITPENPSPRMVKARGKATFNENGEILRFSGTLQDITEERHALMELKRVYEQARLSKETAQLGTFDMDLVRGTLEWDERCRQLFGISHNDEVSYEKDFLPGLHEEDRERISKIIADAFVKEISNGDYDVEYRTVGTDDGQLRWIRARGKVLFNDDNEPQRFIGSVFEITDQKQAELRKNDFIGMVSHELKTPLTTLKAYIQMLNGRARKDGDSFSMVALTKLEQQVNKMSGMINGFLNVSRLESGKIHLNKTSFTLRSLLQEVIDDNVLLRQAHTINLLPCPDITLSADRDKIGQVVANLLSNAVKYSPQGKIVEVGCKLLDDNIRISVRDEGIGIRQEDINRLFDRFYRVESVKTQNISGFGIGLYLCSEIIRRHNGNIWAESEKGQGSTFFFTLPLHDTNNPPDVSEQ